MNADSQSISQCTMSLNVPGLVSMVFFYLLVLGTGIWASMKSKRMKKSSQADQTEVSLLGNRGISLAVGVFTMTGLFRPAIHIITAVSLHDFLHYGLEKREVE